MSAPHMFRILFLFLLGTSACMAENQIYACHAVDARGKPWIVGGVCYNHQVASCHESHIRERCGAAYRECIVNGQNVCTANCGGIMHRLNDIDAEIVDDQTDSGKDIFTIDKPKACKDGHPYKLKH